MPFYIFILILFPNWLYAETERFSERVKIYENSNYIQYIRDQNPRFPNHPGLMEEIIEAENLNINGLKMLQQSCGREDFKAFGDQFLAIIAFSELERMYEICIKYHNIKLVDTHQEKLYIDKLKDVQKTSLDYFNFPNPFLLKNQLIIDNVISEAEEMEEDFRKFTKYYMNFLIVPSKKENYGIISLFSSGGFQIYLIKNSLAIIHNPVKDIKFKKKEIHNYLIMNLFARYSTLEDSLVNNRMTSEERIQFNQSIVKWFHVRNQNIQKHPYIKIPSKNRVSSALKCIKSLSKKHYEEVNFLMWAGFFQDYGIPYFPPTSSDSQIADYEKLLFKKIFDSLIFQLRLEGLEHGCKVLKR